jgi:hypothetical protein
MKGDSGAIGSQGLKGDVGSQGGTGSQGVKGDKGDRGVNPLSSTVLTDGSIVFELNPLNQMKLVRTGVIGTLRLENNTSPALNLTYSAFWHTTNAVGTSTGTVSGGALVVFDLGLAYQFSIMFKVGDQWGKIDLFRADLAATDWYGSWTSN